MTTTIIMVARRFSILAGLLLIACSMANGGSLSHTFENNTGKTAYDLHIKYNRQAKVVSQDPEAFDKVDDGGEAGANVVDLSDGSVANGDSVKIKAESKTGDLEINSWWWTDKNHKPLGKIHEGCSASDGCAEADPMVSSVPGLTTLSFDLPQAKLTVYLPDDMAAGDSISGTVIAEPKRNIGQEPSDSLQGVVVDLGNGQTVPVCDPCSALRSFVIPHVFDQKGRMNVSVLRPGRSPMSTSLPLQPTSTLTTRDPNIPPFVQAGRPTRVLGPFDGTAANTQCSFGGQPAVTLAESPRQSIFKTPGNLTGPVQVNVTDKGRTTTGQTRVLSVQLTSPKTNLTRGEKTNVHMEIKGLKGESRNVPFRLVTTGTASMQGGNVQDILVVPGQISQDGTFVKDFSLTGTSTGAFSVTATVTNPTPVAGNESKCDCKCELSNPPIVTAGVQQEKGGTEHSFEPNIKNASCNGNRCEVSKTEYSWSVGAGSTATYTIVGNNSTSKKFTVKVTKGGTVDLTVTVTVTCSDGQTCSATGSKSFRVKA